MDRAGGCVRGFFIITTTSETHKHYQSFASLPGNEIGVYVYNHRLGHGIVGAALDEDIRAAAARFRPDFVVYVGACGGNVPSPESFRSLREEIAPTIHFCSDAADDPWWPLLEVYERKESFSLQVALDGVLPPPIAESGLAALTPIDLAFYDTGILPHMKRDIAIGFAGNVGQRRKKKGRILSVDPRLEFAEYLQGHGLQVRLRVGGPENYHEVAQFLCHCRMVPNFAQTGSRRHLHVKGRVIEAGLAGATLIEPRGSPTVRWFKPGVDYLEWGNVEEAAAHADRLRGRPEETEAMGARLRARVIAEHSPAAFWRRIFDRLGLVADAKPAPRQIVESLVPVPPVLAA